MVNLVTRYHNSKKMGLIDGKSIAKSIRNRISTQIQSIKSTNPRFNPTLTIFQVGTRQDSSTYVRMKRKASEDAGIHVNFIHLDESITEQSFLAQIDEQNNNPLVHGILIQLPISKHLNESTITARVKPCKDVDGFGPYNIGELNKRNGSPFFIPCTPQGIIELLKQSDVKISGANAVVLGRSDIVGAPVACLLRSLDATVTTLHSKSRNIQNFLQNADIVIVAIGHPEFVKGEWFSNNPNVVVIDVGTNYIEDSSTKSGFRCVGDVEFSSAQKYVRLLTPVPGGVGPMTVAMLMQNVFIAACSSLKSDTKQIFEPIKLSLSKPVPSDFEISRNQNPKPITQIASEAGILPSELELYGNFKAKIKLSILDRLSNRENGKYILITGITPTSLGEGKTTITVGLAQALGCHLNKMAFATVRQPSMGPTFGIKGGAAGGGYSQVIPMDEFNLHLTGDIHAISMANNLLAAAIDARIFHESTQQDNALYRRLVPVKNGIRKFTPTMLRRLEKLGISKTNPDDLTPDEITKFARLDIDPKTITWRRVVDCNDRFLRGITIGEAPTERGFTRSTGFDISVASECMAILSLSNSLKDMRQRLGQIVVATSKSGVPITAEDIGCAGAMAALLKDAIKPNLMQTLEGTPVLVHSGPFANISIGANSVLADKIALKLVGVDSSLPKDVKNSTKGYVVTEAGFDFAMGGEKFLDIKCRSSGLIPNVIVIVVTVRALKVHGGGPEIIAGTPLATEYLHENVELVEKGCSNLSKQITNAKMYNLPVLIAINKMSTDTELEHQVIRDISLKAGAVDAIVSNHWEEGGKGAIMLANRVIEVAELSNSDFKYLYDTEKLSIEAKISSIAKSMYGAAEVEFEPEALENIELYNKQGFDKLPVCIAKTQYSLSHNAKLKGAPTGFKFPIKEIRASIGAGYLYALAAEIQKIPGLPTYCGFMNVELNEDDEIEGMF